MINYLLEVSAAQLLFMTLYALVLKNTTFFSHNRAYLIGTLLFSFLLPHVQLPNSLQAVPVELPNLDLLPLKNPVTIPAEADGGYELIQLVLYLGMFVSALFLAYKLYGIIHSVYVSPKEKAEGYTLVKLPEGQGVYSWFHYVFAAPDSSSPSTIRHEQVHVQKLHSLDILTLELLRIPLWFSPLILWYRRELDLVHEYQADAIAGKDNSGGYAELLLQQIFQAPHRALAHNFWKASQIKKRIKMLNKVQTPKQGTLRYLLLLPLLALLTLQYSCSDQDYDLTEAINFAEVDEKPFYMDRQEKVDFTTHIVNHVKQNFEYPSAAKEEGVQGRVIVKFVLDKEGHIRNAEVVKGVTPILDQEALKLVNSLGKVEPARHEGVPVNVSFMLPITYKL